MNKLYAENFNTLLWKVKWGGGGENLWLIKRKGKEVSSNGPF